MLPQSALLSTLPAAARRLLALRPSSARAQLAASDALLAAGCAQEAAAAVEAGLRLTSSQPRPYTRALLLANKAWLLALGGGGGGGGGSAPQPSFTLAALRAARLAADACAAPARAWLFSSIKGVVAQRVGRCAALEESLRAQGRTDDEAVPAFADAAAAAAAAATAHGIQVLQHCAARGKRDPVGGGGASIGVAPCGVSSLSPYLAPLSPR